MANSRRAVLKLYKTMLREALEFQSYNYRMYAMRRIKDGFHANKSLKKEEDIKEIISYAEENLEMIKRQATIGKLYGVDKLIIEKCSDIQKKPVISKDESV